VKDNWKLWLAVVACVVVAVFFTQRAHEAFYGSPPGWIKQEDRIGAAISKDGKLQVAWKQFSDILGAAQRESAQRQLPVGTISLLFLETSGTDALAIVTEPVVNQGFNPLRNPQSSIGGDEKRFVGFYTTAGAPIPFTIVRVQGRSKNPPVTLHLDATVAPGATQWVVRVEWRRAPVSVTKNGKLQAGLGRFPRAPNAVYVRAVSLPSGSTIVRSSPQETATVQNGSVPLVSWIGGPADGGVPMSVVFTKPK
jgi:hypothetical protein